MKSQGSACSMKGFFFVPCEWGTKKLTTEVASAEVIGEDQDEIGFGGGVALDCPGQQKEHESDSLKQ